LGFERGVRDEFKLDSKEIRLIARVNDRIVGAMVVNSSNTSKYEIRHIAVKESYQRRGNGTALVQYLIDKMSISSPIKIKTIARNTSQSSFKRLGFNTVQDYPDHPKFITHGISFCLMVTSPAAK